MRVTVLTPEKTLYEGEATVVSVPGSEGNFAILDHHAPLVSALGEGQVRIKTPDGNAVTYAVERGFVEVLHNEVALLVIPKEDQQSNSDTAADS